MKTYVSKIMRHGRWQKTLQLIAASLASLLSIEVVYAHEDLDLGISQIKFDRQCHPIVTVKNMGERALPSTFYLSVNPAFITLQKPARESSTQAYSETSKSLRALDRKKKLLPAGGELEVRFDKPIANNPAALTALLNTQGEFWEYNQQNDRLSLPVDCVPGKGEIPGTPEKPAFADLALVNINVKPHSCEVHLTIVNHNKGPIAADAWSGADGIILSVYDVKNEARLAPILLKDIDPAKTLQGGSLHFSETRGPGHYRYSLWQVNNDPDFANNHQDILMGDCK